MFRERGSIPADAKLPVIFAMISTGLFFVKCILACVVTGHALKSGVMRASEQADCHPSSPLLHNAY